VLGKSLRRLAALSSLALAGSAMGGGAAAQAQTADFTPAPGTYVADTSALTITGPGVHITGTVSGGVAVFSFGNVNIPARARIVVTGSRPCEMEAGGDFTLSGTIEGSGISARAMTAGASAGGPGGGAGGADGAHAGAGTGGGGNGSTASDGAGGGGFGGAGGGGSATTGMGGVGGAAYGNLNTTLQAGSGGGGAGTGSSAVGGGGGGGAIELFASGRLTITSSGEVRVNGGSGASGSLGASAGGSGGGIVLHAATLTVTGRLEAAGGAGGKEGTGGEEGRGAGGGGGGGRISYQFQTLVRGGTAIVAGGTTGAKSNSNSATAGTPGVVTEVQLPTSTSGTPGTPRTPGTRTGFLVVTKVTAHIGWNAATLVGLITPAGKPVTYHFEYGTSTRYGTSTVVRTIAAGTRAVLVAARVTGLRPGVVYHFRLVARSSNTTVRTVGRAFRTKARIRITGIPFAGVPKNQGLHIRIRVTSGARMTHLMVMVGRQRVATTTRTSTTVRVALRRLRAGMHTLTIVARSAAGTTRRTVRFRVVAAISPRFTG
jgi:hypothetical protein